MHPLGYIHGGGGIEEDVDIIVGGGEAIKDVEEHFLMEVSFSRFPYLLLHGRYTNGYSYRIREATLGGNHPPGKEDQD